MNKARKLENARRSSYTEIFFMAVPFLEDRARKALKIIASPFRYKVCAGCESIVAMHVTHCPNCHGYRFVESEAAVVEQARLLATRPQQSVTAADLVS
jgi:RNA polymerase subunit RPABC4/transcription elongation factor Spt4